MKPSLKIPFLLAGMICSCSMLSAQNKLKVSANLPVLPDGKKVYLIDIVNKATDSTTIKDHKFELTTKTDSSSFYIVQVGSEFSKDLGFYMHMGPGEVNVSGDARRLSEGNFSGSEFVGRWKEMNSYMEKSCGMSLDEVQDLATQMVKAQNIGDSEASQNLQKKYADYVEKGKAAAKDWLKKYPNDPVSVYVINGFLFNKIPLDEMQDLIKQLGPQARMSRLATLMLNLKMPAVATNPLLNKQAPDFTLTDASGKSVKLSDYKGKYVLLDFWASWCAPCRKEMPFLKKAHEQFGQKNFTLLSLSVDEDQSKWRKALEDEKLSWPQLVDDSVKQAQTLYSITYIPTNFLIDPQGKVIAFGLYGDQVNSVLNSVIK